MSDGILAQLNRHEYFSLETFRRGDVGVKTPVWFAAHGSCAYVFTESDAGKVKRLRNDARIRVAPCTLAGRVTGDWIEGQAARVDDPTTVAVAYAALRAKYGWKMSLVDLGSRLAGRIGNRAILEIELTPSRGTG